MTLEGVTKETFDEASFRAGIAKAFDVELDLVQVLDTVEARRLLLTPSVKVNFQIFAANAEDAETIAVDVTKQESKAKMLDALKGQGVPVTAITAVEATPVNMSAPTVQTTTIPTTTTATTLVTTSTKGTTTTTTTKVVNGASSVTTKASLGNPSTSGRRSSTAILVVVAIVSTAAVLC